MPRTTITIVDDVERLLGVRPDRLSVEWEIPAEREGWRCQVSIGINADRSHDCIYIAVHAHGCRTGEAHEAEGSAFYSALFGRASCRRITRKWLETTLVGDSWEMARFFFGLIVWNVFLNRPETWSLGRYPRNPGETIGMTYFKVVIPALQ